MLVMDGSLEALFDRVARERTGEAVERIADSAADHMLDAAKRITPEESGRARESWTRTPTHRTRYAGEPAAEGGIESSYYVTRFLERGTEPHRIEPEDEEAITPGPGAEPRASAEHPGIRAMRITARAAEETEFAIDEIAQPHLERWAEEIERRAASIHEVR